MLASARTARERCHGRLPGRQAWFLAYFGHFALADGDPDLARSLLGKLPVRTPGTLSLRRHTLIRATESPPSSSPTRVTTSRPSHRQASNSMTWTPST